MLENINWPMSLLVAAIIPAAASAFLVWCCCVVGKRADRKLEERHRVYWLDGNSKEDQA